MEGAFEQQGYLVYNNNIILLCCQVGLKTFLFQVDAYLSVFHASTLHNRQCVGLAVPCVSAVYALGRRVQESSGWGYLAVKRTGLDYI